MSEAETLTGEYDSLVRKATYFIDQIWLNKPINDVELANFAEECQEAIEFLQNRTRDSKAESNDRKLVITAFRIDRDRLNDEVKALTEEKERLQGYFSDWRHKCAALQRRVGELEEYAAEKSEATKLALDAAKLAIKERDALTAENKNLREALEYATPILELYFDTWGEVDEHEDLSAFQALKICQAALSPQPEDRDNDCDHEWIDARNSVVQSGEVCLKCNSIRAASDSEGVPG